MNAKKIGLLLIVPVVSIFFAVYFGIYASKAYYPNLPFEGGSKKNVVEKLENSNRELVTLAKVNGYYWLGFEGNQKEGKDKIIMEMEGKGLKYNYYEGSGIFFGDTDRVVVTGQVWTRKYILYKIPEESFLGTENAVN